MTTELITSSRDGHTLAITRLPGQPAVTVAILAAGNGRELGAITLEAPEGAHAAAAIMRVVLPAIEGREPAGE